MRDEAGDGERDIRPVTEPSRLLCARVTHADHDSADVQRVGGVRASRDFARTSARQKTRRQGNMIAKRRVPGCKSCCSGLAYPVPRWLLSPCAAEVSKLAATECSRCP